MTLEQLLPPRPTPAAPLLLAPPLPARPVDRPAVRLLLDPTLCRRGVVDGAWWPHSDNAGDELPGLAAELARKLGTAIVRIGLHPDTWTHIPRRIPARGRLIKIGWFRSIDPQLISLHTGSDLYDLKLLVIPPDTAPAAAATAFTLASKGRATGAPATILTDARATAPDSVAAQAAHTGWKDDGGHLTGGGR